MRDYNYIRENFYKSYSEEELNKQLSNFLNQTIDVTSGFSNKGKSTNKLISHFFDKDIYSATTARCTATPNEALLDDNMLDKIFTFIDSKPKFYNGDDIQNLKSFFRNAGRWACKVAAFSPNTAKKIYENLCPIKNANILDYSCGFGGRMLGAVSLKYNYHYYGIEPNTNLINSLKDFGEFINSQCDFNYDLYCQGSEDYIEELEGKIDFAFSSPPYFNAEKYCTEDTQSIVKFPKYQDWLIGYVTPTIQNIYKYLKPNGVLAINIKNLTRAGRHPLLDDWTKIILENGFVEVERYDMAHQSSRESLKEYKDVNNLTAYHGEKEPLVVFRKV